LALAPPPRLADAPKPTVAGAATTGDGDGAYRRVPFEKLAGFDYVYGDSLPPEIRALNGKPVRIQGYMTPLEMEGLHVRRFLLTADQAMCCFGVIPPINGWIVVKMRGNGTAPYTNDLMVSVEGRLIVGEKYEDGALSFVYEIIADRVTKIEA
jgi:hypothetical protein